MTVHCIERIWLILCNGRSPADRASRILATLKEELGLSDLSGDRLKVTTEETRFGSGSVLRSFTATLRAQPTSGRS
jgi:hypothetical protein